MIKIITLPVGQLNTNCYLVICKQTKETIIIDPADEANYIGEKILTRNLIPKSIVATHGHFDHCLAAGELQTAFEVPFLLHKKDEKILKNIGRSANYWLKKEIVFIAPKIRGYLDQDSIINFGNCQLRVLHTPGHTPGSICLYSLTQKIVFCGDLVFENGVGRSDFSYSSPLKISQSIEKLNQTTTGFTVYPGHGNKFQR